MSHRSASTRKPGATEESSNSSRESRTESKPERRLLKRATMDESPQPAPARDTQSTATTTSNKDFARGAMKNPAEGGEREGEESSDSKGKKRGDRDRVAPSPPAQEAQGTKERSSASAHAHTTASRRKPPPAESEPQVKEPHRPHVVDLNDISMNSPSSSSDSEGDELYSPTEGPEDLEEVPPPPPQLVTNLKELDLEEELAAAAAAEVAVRKDEDKAMSERDFAIAKQLDHELNARKQHEGGGMPGDYEGAEGSHQRSGGLRAAASSIWNGPIEVQLEKAKAKNAQLKKKAEDMHATAYEYQRAYQHERAQHHRTFQQARAFEMDFNSARKHIHVLDEELKAVRNELAAVKQQLSDAVNLSEVRGKELKGAQVFLTKADTLSVTDVVQKVNALNEEIFQMAAYLGEVLVYEVLEPDANRQESRQKAINGTFDCALNILGETLAHALAQQSLNETKEESNPLLVQIVMQIALTNWCGSFGRRWTSYRRADEESTGETKEGQPKESGSKSSISKQIDHDRFISELYDTIRDHEDQAVAGRWRSLTKCHLPFSTTGWDHSLMLTICSIMSVAGWATRSQDDVGQIEKRLGSIFKPLLDVRKATGEDVTSADLEIAIIQAGQTFDPSYMEDAYADGRSSSKSKKSAPEKVISTSGMGLQKIVVKKLKGGALQRQAEILSMPKVVLEKTIKEALEPPPPTRKRKEKEKVTAGDAAGAGSTGFLGGVFGT